MTTLRLKRSGLILNLSTRNNKMLFLAMNIALILGGLSIITTLLFLLKNLEIADEVLWYCLPGFCLGITLFILYCFGYKKLSETKNQINYFKTISFREAKQHETYR